MSALVKYGAAIVVLGGIAMVGNQSLKAQRAGAVEQFSITQAEEPLLDTCHKAFRDGGIKFRSGVKKIVGCGCITRYVSDRIDPAQQELAGKVIEISLPAVKKEQTKRAEEELAALYLENYQSARSSQKIMDSIGSAIAHCSKPKSYMTEAELAEAKAIRDAGRAEEDARFEQYIADGKMTREQVDHIKAYRDE
ncbi:hypothetical protein [uncultured Hyphomonas sp.]|uniref:hypothetical protein n=1 Tax=uncultured Hyphomonas sp. TaxID=225298 RepID=UPI002AAAB2DE|nr:hypothetical protein [uncultured Hyphomonas sp.]